MASNMQIDTDTPQTVIELDRIFFEHFDLVAQVESNLIGLASKIRRATGNTYIRLKAEVELMDFIRKEAFSYRDWVKTIASRELSEPLAPFNADEIKVLEREFDQLLDVYRRSSDGDPVRLVVQARQACEACAPLKVWAELKRHHDPGAQNRAAAREQASALGRELLPDVYYPYGWRRQQAASTEMKIVKGRVEVCLRVSSEADWAGKGRHLRDDSTLRTFGQAMNFALHQVEPDRTFVCGQRLLGLCQSYEMRRRELVSRERINLGDGVDIVVGFNNFKLYLPQEIAAALNVFVAEHGQPPKD